MATPRKRPEDKLKVGRPTDYNEQIAARICQRVATHACGLKKLCNMYDDMPDRNTVYLWRYLYPEFSGQYAQAKLRQADLLAEECLEISDDSTNDTKFDKEGSESCNTEFVARARLRIDTRKWLASKLLPKQYGEQKLIDDLKSDNERVKAELEELRSRLNESHKSEY